MKITQTEWDALVNERDELRVRLEEASNHEYAGELKAGRDENARLRGAMARLCRAANQMISERSPKPWDVLELKEAHDAAIDLINPYIPGITYAKVTTALLGPKNKARRTR